MRFWLPSNSHSDICDPLYLGMVDVSFSLPYDCIASPLKIKVAVVAAATMTWGGGRLNTDPTKNDIAAPAALYGIHFVIAIRGRSTALLSAISQYSR
jgi:hypothetical protein